MYVSPAPCLARIREDLAALERAVSTVANEESETAFCKDVRELEACIGKLLSSIELLKCSRPLNLSPASIQAAKVAGLSQIQKSMVVPEPGDAVFGLPGYATAPDSTQGGRLYRPGQPEESAGYVVSVFGATYPSGEGRWGAIISAPQAEDTVQINGQEKSADRDRMTLMAAISALRRAPVGPKIVVRTDSAALVYGAERILPALVQNRFPEGRQIKNPDLWRELVAATTGRNITWERVEALPRELRDLTWAAAGGAIST